MKNNGELCLKETTPGGLDKVSRYKWTVRADWLIHSSRTVRNVCLRISKKQTAEFKYMVLHNGFVMFGKVTAMSLPLIIRGSDGKILVLGK